jgi:hypothetical protein
MGNSTYEVVSLLTSQAEAVARLAQDNGGFSAAFAAFESKDPNGFRWVLERLELLPYCELICEWIRVKACVLRCNEICGPVRDGEQIPSLESFARVVARLSENEEGLRRLVDAVSCGDADAYSAVLNDLKLREFCYLVCNWVCSVGYRRVCEVVCRGGTASVADPLAEVRTSAKAVASLLSHERLLATLNDSAVAINCERLQSAIDEAGLVNQCEYICHWVCSYRRVWVCREICRVPTPVVGGIYAVEEARNFALALRQLTSQPRLFSDLVTAVEKRDPEAYSEIISRVSLAPYCLQVCGWVTSVSCYEVCTCVCPQLGSYFTAIGAYLYETQIDSALPSTGLTIGGGPNAFYGTLRLNGALQQELSGQPLEYSFWYQTITKASTTLGGSIGAGDTSLTVASSAGFPSGSFNAVIGSAGGGYEILTVTSVSGTTWTVVRGQQGTAAAAAAAGATIVSGVSASGAWTQVPAGWIPRTVIGQQITGFIPHLIVRDIAVNGNPGDVPAPFTVDGWIQVPQGSDIYLNNNLINLDSTQLPGFINSNENAVTAGNAATPGAPTDLFFGLQMRVRQAGSATYSPGGTCNVVAVDNFLYSQINHHPEWGAWVGNNAYGVAMVDIKELQAAGCAGITNSLTVLFTASSPNLGSVSISMVGNGVSYSLGLPTPVPQTGNWYGIATNPFNISNLEPCAYLITLSVDLLLTTGDDSFPNPLQDQIAFCLS